MEMSEIQKKLYELSEGQVSNWSKEADYRLKNHKWLRYSHQVASRILAAMEDKKGMTQKKLAKLMAVSPQQISKILKGHENLTLETISKFSEALGIELISFPDYKYSVPAKARKPAPRKKASGRAVKKKSARS
ncbi:MAG TPA: helix-turn-helix transcriptional regulator [Puia sp.]|nr:helix-turn-helix transcriptional regulator [Puia sp.]